MKTAAVVIVALAGGSAHAECFFASDQPTDDDYLLGAASSLSGGREVRACSAADNQPQPETFALVAADPVEVDVNDCDTGAPSSWTAAVARLTTPAGGTVRAELDLVEVGADAAAATPIDATGGCIDLTLRGGANFAVMLPGTFDVVAHLADVDGEQRITVTTVDRSGGCTCGSGAGAAAVDGPLAFIVVIAGARAMRRPPCQGRASECARHGGVQARQHESANTRQIPGRGHDNAAR